MAVQNFSNIVLFDDRGYEIELQRLFNFEFNLTFSERLPFYVVSSPDLCVSGNSDLGNPQFEVVVNNGGIFRPKDSQAWSDKYFNSADLNFINIEIVYHAKNGTAYTLGKSRGLTKDMFHFTFEEIKIYSEDPLEPASIEYKIKSIETTETFDTVVHKFLYGASSQSGSKKAVVLPGVAEEVGARNLFPFYNFISSYKQEPVSTELVSATTFFMLQEDTNGNEKVYKEVVSSEYDLIFYFDKSSEVRFIKNNKNTDEISWSYSNIITLPNPEDMEESEYPEPLSFSIGFTTTEEGCYQNNMRVYARSKKDPKDIFYLGAVTIKSESIGEDERYRTLFTNFGIPDPVTYPNLFKEQDPDEEGVDYELINRKSKELFLTYDKIFPYVGTYKALINAVRFLGYDDIYFKEWYKIIDKDRESTNALFTSVDFANGEILPSSLAKYGISPEDFFNYKKLNKLSLIYMLNTIDDSYDIQTVNAAGTGEKTEIYFDVPTVIRNFEYTNDAVLAKLYSLKAWLEKYIIGINARISDVTGEGVYFYRFETTAYSTGNVLIDYFNENHLTPYQVKNSTSDGKMVDSSANLTCSVYEFDNMKVSDYDKVTFKDFIYELCILGVDRNTGEIKATFTNNADDIAMYVPNKHVIDSIIPISHPFKAPLLFNELSYNLETESSCGTLYEYTAEDTSNNPILIHDNKIEFYDAKYVESKISNNFLPTIVLKKANLRKTYGDWSDNIVYTIKPVINSATSETMYQMQLVSYPSSVSSYYATLPKILSSNDIVLSPYVIFEKDEKGLSKRTIDPNASFKYTQKTKYNVPLFIISNYTIDTESETKEFFNIKDKEFVLEILDGELRFDTKSVSNNDGGISVAMTSEVTFAMEDWNNYTGNARDEQIITPIYNFQTEKFNVVEYTLNGSETLDTLCKSIRNNDKIKYLSDIDTITANKKKLFIKKAISEYKLPWVDNENRDIFKESSISYEEILEDVSNGINAQGHTLQLDDIYEGLFIGNRAKINEYVSDSIVTDISRIDEKLYNDFARLLKNPAVYKVNKDVGIKVNRLGNYKLSAFGYDKYNNIFTNRCNTVLKVFGVAPEIDLYTNTSFSNNTPNFYKSNIQGELLHEIKEDGNAALTSAELISKFEDSPKFPKTYRIYDLSIGKDDVTYPSISYAIDSPKSTDYLYFNNFTEVGTYIRKDEETGTIKISMLDENEDKTEVYYYGCTLMAYVFDNICLDLKYSFGPMKVVDFYKQESLTDTNYYDDSYIKVTCSTDSSLQSQDIIDEINMHVSDIGDWILFVDPVTETIVDNNLVTLYNYKGVGKVMVTVLKNTASNKSIDYATMLTPIYHIGDVVKLTYEVYKQKFNEYDFFDYKGETSYRIANVEQHKNYVSGSVDTYDNTSSVTYIYTLDGPVNTHLLEGLYDNMLTGSSIYCKLSYPCFDFMSYIVNAKSNGDEEVIVKNITNNANETLETRMTVAYDSSNWFANDYLDNTYSMYDIDYTPEKLKSDWFNASTLFDASTEIYRYSNYPVTLEKDSVLAVSSTDRNHTFNSYNSRWKWMIRYADKNDYYPYDYEYYIGERSDKPMQKVDSILYRSINDVITIKTNYAGNNDIILEAIDKFGNRLYNNGEGLLMVNNETQAEQISLINK